MLQDRLAIAIPLIPLAVWVIVLGGPVYALIIAVMLALAAREYAHIFQTGGRRPARLVLMLGAPLLMLARAYPAGVPGWMLAAALVGALLWHLVDFERGAQASGTDFAITLGGLLYLGWMGGYFIVLRNAAEGFWWSAVLFGAIWIADSAAYIAGRAWGRRPLAPRLSPKKTWEGFAGGVVGGALAGALLASLGHLQAGAASLVDWPAGAALGALMGLAGPVGDLGISMLKRETGVKDSGDLLAGHGGVLDRIDSWFIAIPLGYYAVRLLQMFFAKGGLP